MFTPALALRVLVGDVPLVDMAGHGALLHSLLQMLKPHTQNLSHQKICTHKKISVAETKLFIFGSGSAPAPAIYCHLKLY